MKRWHWPWQTRESPMEKDAAVLEPANWLYFKLYRHCGSTDSWKTPLDWYHRIVTDIIKPWVVAHSEIRYVFFGIYGPEAYRSEPLPYERRLTNPEGDFGYVRLRACMMTGRDSSKSSLLEAVQTNTELVSNYEILEYRVRDDLGNRYGRQNDGTINEHRTVMFVRYWDAACRYILDILTGDGNWASNVDVWGIPHLVNNSLGGWLRLSNAQCPNCSRSMYMATDSGIPQALRGGLAGLPKAPICLFICPQCSTEVMGATNI